MQSEYFVSHGGNEFGPFIIETIVNQLKTGQLAVEDYVYVEAESDWICLRDFKPLADHLKDLNLDSPENSNTETSPMALPDWDHNLIDIEEIPEWEPAAESPPVTETLNETPADLDTDPNRDLESKKKNTFPELPTRNDSVYNQESSELQQNKERLRALAIKKSPDHSTETNYYDDHLLDCRVQLEGGSGFIEIEAQIARKIWLSVQNENDHGFQITSPKELEIVSGPATQFIFKANSTATAGQAVEVSIEAQDDYGNIDLNFEGKVQLLASCDVQGTGVIDLVRGIGSTHLINERAEIVTLTLKELVSSIHSQNLNLSSTANIEFHAGPAVKFVICAPDVAVAGTPIRVTIEAHDQFGNRDKNFSGVARLKPTDGYEKTKTNNIKTLESTENKKMASAS